MIFVIVIQCYNDTEYRTLAEKNLPLEILIYKGFPASDIIHQSNVACVRTTEILFFSKGLFVHLSSRRITDFLSITRQLNPMSFTRKN